MIEQSRMKLACDFGQGATTGMAGITEPFGPFNPLRAKNDAISSKMPIRKAVK